MTTPQQYDGALEGLLARVEKAEGADRELDLAIGLALCGWKMVPSGLRDEGEWLRADDCFYASTNPGSDYPSPTESLDYALSLCERALPGWEAKFTTGSPTRQPTASLIPHMRNNDGWALGPASRRERQANTPALALLCALITALIAQGKADTTEPTGVVPGGNTQ